MSKYSPRRFGDRLDVNVGGTVQVEQLSDEELQSRLRSRLASIGVEMLDQRCYGILDSIE